MSNINIESVAKSLYDRMSGYTGPDHEDMCIKEILMPWIKSQEDEIHNRENWVNDLQSGMYINCVYCGYKYGLESEVSASMGDIHKKHVAKCREHPMSKLVDALRKIRNKSAMAGYEYGDSGIHKLADDALNSVEKI